MSWHSSLSWLAALFSLRGARRAREPDHGDMGTAFGLDASLDFGDFERSGELPALESERWEHRLIRRSSL